MSALMAWEYVACGQSRLTNSLNARLTIASTCGSKLMVRLMTLFLRVVFPYLRTFPFSYLNLIRRVLLRDL